MKQKIIEYLEGALLGLYALLCGLIVWLAAAILWGIGRA